MEAVCQRPELGPQPGTGVPGGCPASGSALLVQGRGSTPGTGNKSLVAEKIDELVLRKIPQIVRAKSSSFIVPVYSSVVSQIPL